MRGEMAPAVSEVAEGTFKGDKNYDHPAYGQVTVIKWTSGGAGSRLFGSDLAHSTGLTITVSGATVRRGNSSDYRHATDTLLEFSMSEGQWAQLVSSIGDGSGVPVTLQRYRIGELRKAPRIAVPELSRKELHAQEMKESVAEALSSAAREIDELGRMIDEGKLGKQALRDMHGRLSRAIGQLPGNIKFAFDMFDEALAKAVDHAKIEINAHVEDAVRRHGNALGGPSAAVGLAVDWDASSQRR